MKKDITLMKMVILLLFMSSFSLILSLFGDYNGNTFNIIMAYAVGVLFWGGLIAGYALLAVINSHRKNCSANKTDTSAGRAGIISFFSDRIAMIFDCAMPVLLILTIVFMFIPFDNPVLTVIVYSLLAFSIHMHCLFNGMNFKYIKSMKKKESRING